MAAGTGRLLADLLSDRTPEIDPDRLDHGPLWQGLQRPGHRLIYFCQTPSRI